MRAFPTSLSLITYLSSISIILLQNNYEVLLANSFLIPHTPASIKSPSSLHRNLGSYAKKNNDRSFMSLKLNEKKN